MTIDSTDYQLMDVWTDSDAITYRNVYYLRRSTGTDGAAELLDEFLLQMVPKIANCISTGMQHVRMEAFNLVTSTDFAVLTDATGGGRTGTLAPPFLAASLRFERSDRNFRAGSKRYGRLSISDVGSKFLSATLQTNMGTLAAQIESGITYSGHQFDFMIPRRVKDGSGKYVLNDLSIVTNVTVRGLVTSQNSRKVNVGE